MSLYCATRRGHIEIVPRGATVEIWMARHPDLAGRCCAVLEPEQLSELISTLEAARVALNRTVRVLEIKPGVYGVST